MLSKDFEESPSVGLLMFGNFLREQDHCPNQEGMLLSWQVVLTSSQAVFHPYPKDW